MAPVRFNGHYSPELAREYFSEKIEEEAPEIDNDILELLEWFMSHGERWLEIATSILMAREWYPDIGAEETVVG